MSDVVFGEARELAVAIAALGFMAFLAWIFLAKRVVFLIFIFLLFTFVWRTAAAAYVDLAGPVYASQLVMQIGGGIWTIFQTMAYVLTLLPFLWVFRKQAVAAWVSDMPPMEPSGQLRPSEPGRPARITLADIAVAGTSVFLVLLFLGFVVRGDIPALSGMERWEYNDDAWIGHQLLLRFGDFLCFGLGMMFAAVSLREGRMDRRFLVLLLLILAYYFLTGNRFSPFYRSISFFAMPYAAVVAVRAATTGRSGLSRNETILALGALAIGGVIASTAIYLNLTGARQFVGDEVVDQLYQRILVQPVEMGVTSFERVFLQGIYNPDLASHFVFFEPIVPGTNTAPQFLMLMTIAEPRTSLHVLNGFQFAGGFPEIFFELFGPFGGWLFVAGSGVMTALLCGLIVKAVIKGSYVTAFLGFYVLFGVFVMYIGGMVTFALATSYWIKLAALAAAVVLERALLVRGRRLLPWSFEVPAHVAAAPLARLDDVRSKVGPSLDSLRRRVRLPSFDRKK